MRHVLKRRELKAVVVTLKSGMTFRGALWDQDSQAVVIRNVQHIASGSTPDAVTSVDGEIVVLVGDVAFFQFVG